MTMNPLKLGGVYNWSGNINRVIGFDEIEVFYDSLWTHNNSWTFSGNFKKMCYFYRTSSSLFAEQSIQTDFLPLTEEEENAFRPDLVIRLGRIKELSWNNIKATDLNSFTKGLNPDVQKEKLQTNKIVLIPYGNKGGLKKGTIISADNSEYFECAELLWKAKTVQEAVSNQLSNGIGLYRLGFEKGLPSYYIGEYVDSAGLLSE